MPVLLDPAYPLRTERLLLRPYERGDLPWIRELFGRVDVARYLMWPPLDEEGAQALLERRLRQARIEQEGGGIAVVVLDAATEEPVGEVVLNLRSVESRQGEVGWSIHPSAQGHGYATEAAREMLRLGFDELGLHRIIAECDPRNDASMRVMARLGMRAEANHVDSMWLKGEWAGSYVAAMLETEWRDRRDGGPPGR